LMVAGLAGAAWMLARVWRRDVWRGLTAPQLSVLCFALGIIGNTILIQFYYWASFDDAMAARFALPLLLLLAIAALPAAAALDRKWPVSQVATACALLYTLGMVVPKQAAHRYSNPAIQEIEWERRVVAARASVPRLVVTNKTPLPWLLERIPAVFLATARGEADRLSEQMESGGFAEIIVTQELRPISAEGPQELVPEDQLPASFHLETIAEHRFGAKIARISRLVAIEPSPPDAAGPAVKSAE